MCDLGATSRRRFTPQMKQSWWLASSFSLFVNNQRYCIFDTASEQQQWWLSIRRHNLFLLASCGMSRRQRQQNWRGGATRGRPAPQPEPRSVSTGSTSSGSVFGDDVDDSLYGSEYGGDDRRRTGSDDGGRGGIDASVDYCEDYANNGEELVLNDAIHVCSGPGCVVLGVNNRCYGCRRAYYCGTE